MEINQATPIPVTHVPVASSSAPAQEWQGRDNNGTPPILRRDLESIATVPSVTCRTITELGPAKTDPLKKTGLKHQIDDYVRDTVTTVSNRLNCTKDSSREGEVVGGEGGCKLLHHLRVPPDIRTTNLREVSGTVGSQLHPRRHTTQDRDGRVNLLKR